MRACILMILLICLAGCGAKEQPVKENLEGTWMATSANLEGKPGALGKWVFRKDRLEFRNEDVLFAEAKYTLDEGKSGEIDIVNLRGPAQGKKLRGIYQRNGDRLKICYVSPSKNNIEQTDRPTSFESKPGSGVWLYELERIKP